MVKVDPDVKSPADELLACCVIFSARESSRPEARRKSGPKPRQGELKRVTRVSNVEDTLVTSPLLEWLLKPETRPETRRRP